MKLTRRRALSAVAGAATIAGFPSIVRSATQSLQVGQIGNSVAFFPVFVAAKLGYYKDAGLDVTATSFSSGTLVGTAVTSNSIDIGNSVITDVFALLKANRPVKLVGSLCDAYYIDIVASNQFLAATKLSRTSPLADKINALKGKHLGITGPGSGTQALADYLFRLQGLDSTRDVELVNIGADQAAVLQAMKTGRIDAVSFAWPMSMIAEANNIGKAFIVPATDIPSMRDQVQGVIYAKPDLLSKRNDAVVAYVRAIARAETYVRQNTKQARGLLKEYDGALSDPAIDALLAAYIPVLPHQADIAANSYEKALQFHRLTGFAGPSGNTFAEVVDTTTMLKAHAADETLPLRREPLRVVRDGQVYDITEHIARAVVAAPFQRGDAVTANLDAIVRQVEGASLGAAVGPAGAVKFLSPVLNPTKIIGAPVNYEAHIAESEKDAGISFNNAVARIDKAGLFLIATSALIGPSEGVAVRFSDRRTDHEIELGVVIGRQCSNVSEERALDVVAGYAIALDMTVRGTEDRSFRKSIDTYAVLGPWLVTPDELREPDSVEFTLKVNGVVKQQSNTSRLIFKVRKLIAWASNWYTLYPGDIIMTGTPEGCGPVVPGDVIDCEMQYIGSMSVDVRQAAVYAEDSHASVAVAGMNSARERVIVAGGGPVGLMTALGLAHAGVPVLLIEQEPALTVDLRAGSYHPPTLEAMAPYGITDRMLERGIKVRHWQIRDRKNPAWVADWDLGLIADLTPYPYRLHLEQHRLTPIILEFLRREPLADVQFNARFVDVAQTANGVRVTYERDGTAEVVEGAYLVGADGGRSNVRKAIAMPFEGFTWDERFMVISTSFDFQTRGYAKNVYLADPDQWATLFQMPGDVDPYWRIVIPTDIAIPEDVIAAPAAVEAWLQSFEPRDEPYEVLYNSFYRVHQRVARNFRSGRVLLAGDAAHLNNPLGAFGLNSGIQDAANLIPKLAAVCHGTAPESLLDLYDRQRHTATVEHVQANSIANKRTRKSATPELRRAHFEELVTRRTPPN